MSQSDRMRVLIAEDESVVALNLKRAISREGFDVANIIKTIDSLNSEIALKSFDVALLDIKMGDRDIGIEMAEILNHYKIPFVFISSYSDKTTLQKAVRKRPYAYIVKPYHENEIYEVLESLNTLLGKNKITLKEGRSIHRISISDIVYMSSENVYVKVELMDRTIMIRSKLNDLEKKLPQTRFCRTHQSYMVNLDYFQEMNESEIILKNGAKIPVSRKYSKEVRNLLD